MEKSAKPINISCDWFFFFLYFTNRGNKLIETFFNSSRFIFPAQIQMIENSFSSLSQGFVVDYMF